MKKNICLYCGVETNEVFCCSNHQLYYRRRHKRNNKRCIICDTALLSNQKTFCSQQCKHELEIAKQTGKAISIRVDTNTIILTKKYDQILETKHRMQEQKASLSVRKKIPILKDSSREYIILS